MFSVRRVAAIAALVQVSVWGLVLITTAVVAAVVHVAISVD